MVQRRGASALRRSLGAFKHGARLEIRALATYQIADPGRFCAELFGPGRLTACRASARVITEFDPKNRTTIRLPYRYRWLRMSYEDSRTAASVGRLEITSMAQIELTLQLNLSYGPSSM